MARLAVRERDGEYSLELTGEPITVGRGTGNPLRLRDPRCSREHCRIESGPRGFRLTDLNSRNGTYVNGLRIREQSLQDGDRIRIGSVTLVFYAADVPAPPRVETPPPSEAWRGCTLTLVREGGEAEVFPINREIFAIGRSRTNDLTLPQERDAVSHQHAEIRRDPEGDGFLLIDSGSKNGTFVNGERTESAVLDDGDEIQIGSVTLVFHQAPLGAARELEPTDVEPEEGLVGATPGHRGWILGAGLAAALILAAALSFFPRPHDLGGKNLLTENPSFEQGRVTAPTGWDLPTGAGVQATWDRQVASRGSSSLRLEVEADRSVEAAARSRQAVSVRPGKTYVLSGAIQPDAAQAKAFLSITWRNAAVRAWRETVTTNVIAGAAGWNRADLRAVAPPWANRVRITCHLAGRRGRAWFDRLRLTLAAEPLDRASRRAGRLTVTINRGARLSLQRAGRPVLADSRPILVDMTGQILGSTDLVIDVAGEEPTFQPGQIVLSGKLLPAWSDRTVPFQQAISQDGPVLRYQLGLKAEPRRFRAVGLQFRLPPEILRGGVRLVSERAPQTFDRPFTWQPDVVGLALGKGDDPTFVMFGQPMVVSCREQQGDFILRATRRIAPQIASQALSARFLTLSPTLQREGQALAASAAQALEDGNFAAAWQHYDRLRREFLFLPEAREWVQGGRRRLADAFDQQRAVVAARLARARVTLRDEDFAGAEEEARRLVKVFARTPMAESMQAHVAGVAGERTAAASKRLEAAAQQVLTKAKLYAGRKEFALARVHWEYVVERYPKTQAAGAAKAALTELGPPLE